MNTLFLIVNPSDQPLFDGDLLWDLLTGALESAAVPASSYSRLTPPTEAALRQALGENDCDILYVITQAEDSRDSSYSTIALLSADNHYRYLSARRFSQVLSEFRPPKLIVLRATRDSQRSFAALAQELMASGVPAVICTPPFRVRTEQLFIGKLYGGLLSGDSLNYIARELSEAAATPGNEALSQVSFYGKDIGFSASDLSAKDLVQPAKHSAEAPHAAAPSNTHPIGDTDPDLSKVELQRKRDRGLFDVFLSYNSEDRPEVLKLGSALKQAGILPWLDVWELQPGQLWQQAIYDQLHKIGSAAICIGSGGIHRWQEHEINTLFIEFVERKAPVIPVLLPNASANPEVPNFLRTLNWVDFRTDDPPPLERLIWGITGKRIA